MNDLHMINAMQEMLYYSVVGVCIITVPTLVVGLLLSILQSATQLNEATMTFIPKFLLMFALISSFGPWMLNKLVLILQGYMTHLTAYIR